MLNIERALEKLKADPDFRPKQLKKGDVPYLGVLFKKSRDLLRATDLTRRKGLF